MTQNGERETPGLRWRGREDSLDEAEKAPDARQLKQDPELSYGEDSENMLLHGDNVEALKSLIQLGVGKAKCIFIDPPYNTKTGDFKSYNDSMKHSEWLSFMFTRIKLLYRMLSNDGTMWITINDQESHYLKLLCDETFGRQNFLMNFVWEKKYGRQNNAKYIAEGHDHILVYAKDINEFPGFRAKKKSLGIKRYFGGGPTKNHTSDVLKSIWCRSDVGDNGDGREQMKDLNQYIYRKTKKKLEQFKTAKPEKLIKRILDLATSPGETVLDAFLGSGTTAAVAHKMRRKYIGIEIGSHMIDVCLPRLRRIIDGDDRIGVSDEVAWRKAGGFKFFSIQ